MEARKCFSRLCCAQVGPRVKILNSLSPKYGYIMKNHMSFSVASLSFFFFHFFLLQALALDIPLTLEEPAGVARVDEPVTSGVPLPPNTQTTTWALFDGAQQIPVQITRLPGRTPMDLVRLPSRRPSFREENSDSS